MIPVFIEAALRSLLVGLAVAAGLRIFRVRNVLAQKAAWGLVLVSAVAMPLLLTATAQWRFLPAGFNVVLPTHPMTLLEELQARILAKGGSGNKLVPQSAPIHHSDPPEIQESPTPDKAAHPRPGEATFPAPTSQDAAKQEQDSPSIPGSSGSSPVRRAAYEETQSLASVRHITVSPIILVCTLYGGVAALFLLRLALGLFATIRLWRAATPVPADKLPHDVAWLSVRSSSKVASPLTIGSAILLPADCTTWDNKKLRVVLAHERSHIRQCDSYLQVLASLYTSLVWFSPLGWWLKHELAELAEAISDRAGMEEAASSTSYAQILLEFAAAPRRMPIGVAMARPGSLSRRIERLLNDNCFRQCFEGGRRVLVAVVLVLAALFASTTLVHVRAAADAQAPSTASNAEPAAMDTSTISILPQLKPLRSILDVEAIQLEDQALPQLTPVTPTLPSAFSEGQTPALEPVPVMVALASPAPLSRVTPVVSVVASGTQEDGELSFDRTLSVSGAPQLEISTGSGDIKIARSSSTQVHIHGHIHVNHDGSEDLARQIAAKPPIEQNGDVIRVGHHEEHWRGISIDYEIEAPAQTQLTANSGSGNIDDDGVGQNAKLQTGSGDISATSLEGPFMVKTGSGNITAAQTGEGDVVAETGSGEIELKDIHGSFHGQTGSGDIKASGTPSSSWTLQTGSGNIELSTNNSALTLDASTGSGSVNTEHEMVVQGSFDQHHVKGTLNGGGPTVRVQTGSGDIHIH